MAAVLRVGGCRIAAPGGYSSLDLQKIRGRTDFLNYFRQLTNTGSESEGRHSTVRRLPIEYLYFHRLADEAKQAPF